MRNLGFLSAIAVLTLPVGLSADDGSAAQQHNSNQMGLDVQPDACCDSTKWSVQVRGAAFISLKEQLREVYCSGMPTLELEGSYSLYKDKWWDGDQLLLWENVGWTSKSGSTEGFGYYTKLNLLPISVGLTYQFNIASNTDFYIGLAPAYSFLWIKNYDGFTTKHHKRSQFGLTTKTGFRYTFCTNYFIDIFGDYYYTKFDKIKDSIQTLDGTFSGFFVGAGFGGKF